MNKCYLDSTIEKLEQEIIDFGYDEFINKYKKVDIFIGDSEIIKFIEKILKKNLEK